MTQLKHLNALTVALYTLIIVNASDVTDTLGYVPALNSPSLTHDLSNKLGGLFTLIVLT